MMHLQSVGLVASGPATLMPVAFKDGPTNDGPLASVGIGMRVNCIATVLVIWVQESFQYATLHGTKLGGCISRSECLTAIHTLFVRQPASMGMVAAFRAELDALCAGSEYISAMLAGARSMLNHALFAAILLALRTRGDNAKPLTTTLAAFCNVAPQWARRMVLTVTERILSAGILNANPSLCFAYGTGSKNTFAIAPTIRNHTSYIKVNCHAHSVAGILS